MRVYNPQSDRLLHKELQNLLDNYQAIKNFNANDYIEAKARLLNAYMVKFGLKSCVVAVSGGIDSAAVLGIVSYASKILGSPIEKILPVCLPVSHSSGATGQDSATSRGKEVIESYGLLPYVLELKEPHSIIEKIVSSNTCIESKDWALGQLVAHTRTPTLYYCATVLTQEKLPAIICGTTNRDEGLYLGYFGKASDGLVDVQIISDLHKSEVYKVAKELNTPDSIMKVTPQGDMYDGRIDEEVFGAPYGFVEYYLYYLSLNLEEKSHIYLSLSQEAQEQFTFFKNNLENLHQYNRHKYFGASPAVHLDLDLIHITEGWKTNCSFAYLEQKLKQQPVNTNNFVGLVNNSDMIESLYHTIESTCIKHTVQNNTIYQINNAFSKEEINWLLLQSEQDNWKTANNYGKYEEGLSEEQSLRTSLYNENLAQCIFKRITKHVPHLKINYNNERILNNKLVWSISGINPLMRYIRYSNEQQLIAHYDDTYQYHENKKTLMTVVIYLEDSPALTRFILDPQSAIEEKYRNYQDHDALGIESLLDIPAKAGQILIFDHRILHDATSPNNIRKTIIRTDVIFEAPLLGFDL